MRVHTKIVFDIDGNVLEDECYEYHGPVSQCLGGGKKGGGDEEQTVTTGPPDWLQNYQRGLAEQSRQYFGGPATTGGGAISGGGGGKFGRSGQRLPAEPGTAEFFPGQTFAGFAPEQEEALGLQAARARAGSPVTRSAQDLATSTLRGDFLAGGPGFEAAYQSAANRIIPQVSSTFGRAGRTGSGLAQTAQTQALGDAFANLYGQERGRQLTAAALSPQLAAQDYADIGALSQVGAQRQGLEQQSINEAMARHDFPYQQLVRQANLLGAITPGAGQVQTSPLYRNTGAGILGGALVGGGLAGEGGPLSGILPPWLGALGGGLLGGFL